MMRNLEVKRKTIRGLILNDLIKNLGDLYLYISKRQIALLLGLNPVSFSNTKALFPEKFKLQEIQTLSRYFEVPLEKMMFIFLNSMKIKEDAQ